MIQIDGAKKSGSGTVLRYAVSLSCLLGQDLRITNIRAKRSKPGVRPQHLMAVQAAAQLSEASIEGAQVGSKELLIKAGKGPLRWGRFQWDIGTAGSTTMIAMTILPLACFAPEQSTFRIQGGLFQDFAPSGHYMKYVLLPILRMIGINAELNIIRPGFVPKGGGIIELTIQPVVGKLKPLTLTQQGQIKYIKGIAVSSHLKHRRVSQRMADSFKKQLQNRNYAIQIETVYDEDSLQAGAALSVWAQTDTGCLLGADLAGKLGRSSEEIGRQVAINLLEDIDSGATLDRYLSDQLIIYAGLAGGTTEYLIPSFTEHIDSNLWLIQKILGAKVHLSGNHLRIDGVGFLPMGE
jgi:RNA 3'-terminal phosphate cyclase (ATP)